MNKFLPILFTLLILCISGVDAQNPPTRGTADDPILNQPKILTSENLMIENTYYNLEQSLRNKDQATNDVMTADDIQSYVELFADNPQVEKTVDYQTAFDRIESSVTQAAINLKKIGNAQNVTKMGSKAFYGDDYQITQIIQHRVDIVDEKGQGVILDIVFVEINGVYKILSANDEF